MVTAGAPPAHGKQLLAARPQPLVGGDEDPVGGPRRLADELRVRSRPPPGLRSFGGGDRAVVQHARAEGRVPHPQLALPLAEHRGRADDERRMEHPRVVQPRQEDRRLD
eukprot:1617764-Pyramimonas_sp.AAC.1